MKTKAKSSFACAECGHTSSQWLGKCPACQVWGSLVEDIPLAEDASHASLRRSFQGTAKIATLAEIEQGETATRIHTGMTELDRVLGGGLMPDSFLLLGGDPGIGKSTLLLQMLGGLLHLQPVLKMLYISGEESLRQIQQRAERLGVKHSPSFWLGSETELETVLALLKEVKPDLCVLDSLQTFASSALPGAPGSSAQVREVASRLMTVAKSARMSILLVGHVTKDGAIAGPKTVEHLVDTVLYFEGEAGLQHRLLRTVKNRFGSTRELGVFEMTSLGLVQVKNPSALFLSARRSPVSGTSVTALLEGSRPLCIELQALVTPSGMAMPRRTAVGLESTRLSMLAAVLEKHLELRLQDQDLFFNVSGGLKLQEPSGDLAAIAAIWSSAMNQPLPWRSVWLGELSLTGEIRPVAQLEARLQEAERLGFQKAFLHQGQAERVRERTEDMLHSKLELYGLAHVGQLPSRVQGEGLCERKTTKHQKPLTCEPRSANLNS
jgi:DNA repair protein RadA/Sms